MNNKDYLYYVAMAKKELKQIEGHEIRICELAMKVCVIRHGGRSNGYYTITDFAKDIGMPNKTLQNWLLTYRNVVQKLDKPVKTSKDFELARKVENALREERRIVNRIEEKAVGSRYAQSQTIPVEKVRNMFEALEQGDKPFHCEFAGIIRGIKHAYSVLQKRDLNIISDDQLAHVMELMDKSSDIINSHLTKKKKQNGRAA